MAKITFTHAQKAKAMIMVSKKIPASQICEEIGCSPASLQNWKKEYREHKFSLNAAEEDGDEQEEQEEKPSYNKPVQPHSHQTRSSSLSREDFIKKYWQFRTVDAVMQMPETIDEVVKLINHALAYAHDHLAD